MNEFRSKDFTDPDTRATLAIVFISILIVVTVCCVISDYYQYDLLQRIAAGENVTAEEAELNDLRQSGFAIVFVLSVILELIFFLMWVYRAYSNLQGLGHDTQWSPGMAVGYFFIPIFNLFRPYQAVKEIWENSFPQKNSGIYIEKTSSGIVGVWWALMIFANIMGQIEIRVYPDPQTIQEIIDSTVVSLIGYVPYVFIGILLLKIVRTVSKAQVEKRQAYLLNPEIESQAPPLFSSVPGT